MIPWHTKYTQVGQAWVMATCGLKLGLYRVLERISRASTAGLMLLLSHKEKERSEDEETSYLTLYMGWAHSYHSLGNCYRDCTSSSSLGVGTRVCSDENRLGMQE